MSEDTEDLVLDQVDDAPETEAPERPTVRESLKSAWKEHSTEPEDKPERQDKQDKPQRDRVSKPATDTDRGAAKQEFKPQADTQVTKPDVAATSLKVETADWARTPPSVQQAITKRLTEMDAGAKQLQQRYGGIHQTVQRLSPVWQKYGQTPDQGMALQTAWVEALETNPTATIKALADQYRVDLRQLATNGTAVQQPQRQNGYAQQQYQDPRYDSLEKRLEAFQQSKTEEAYNAWKANKPHADKLKDTMATILAGAAQTHNTAILDATGTKIDMDKVYEMASWQHPEVRELIQKEQREAAKKAREDDLAKVRRTGASRRSGPPGAGSDRSTPSKKGEGVRDTLKRVVDELRS